VLSNIDFQMNDHAIRRLLRVAIRTLGVLLVAGHLSLSAAERQPTYDYAAQTEVDGYTIRVGLIHNHELLAEYRKIVEVVRNGTVVATHEYRDPGGFASFYLLRREKRLIVVDGLKRGFVLELDSGKTQPAKLADVPSGFDSQSFGRFMFVARPKREYKWVKAEDVPK
jgi:hypothetical protein